MLWTLTGLDRIGNGQGIYTGVVQACFITLLLCQHSSHGSPPGCQRVQKTCDRQEGVEPGVGAGLVYATRDESGLEAGLVYATRAGLGLRLV